MRPVQVFISYRRDDAAGYARAIGDELAKHFGADRVFIDVDDIGAGVDFSDVIERKVGAARVLLVLIGRRWQGERESAAPRLHDSADLVRREVGAGLASGARVIPVLLDGTAMPTEQQLPDELRALAGRNAIEIGNSRYASDIVRLVRAVREALGEPDVPPPPPTVTRRGKGLAAGLVGAALVIGGVLAWRLSGTAMAPSAAPPAALPTEASATRPDINGLWQADVRYDWPNADHVERFDLQGEGTDLHGTASFLRVPRGVLEGRVDGDGVRFVTRTTEVGAAGSVETVHRYRGRFTGGEIRFTMQTEGGSSAHAPVTFVARRAAAAALQASGPGR